MRKKLIHLCIWHCIAICGITGEDAEKVNAGYLPKMADLRTAAARELATLEKPRTLKEGGQILIFYAIVDDEPLLLEGVVALFFTEQGTAILCDLYRQPYAMFERFARWEFLLAPEYDFSGGGKTIGWQEYAEMPTFRQFRHFLAASGHQFDEKGKMVIPVFRGLMTYVNEEQLKRLWDVDENELWEAGKE